MSDNRAKDPNALAASGSFTPAAKGDIRQTHSERETAANLEMSRRVEKLKSVGFSEGDALVQASLDAVFGPEHP